MRCPALKMVSSCLLHFRSPHVLFPLFFFSSGAFFLAYRRSRKIFFPDATDLYIIFLPGFATQLSWLSPDFTFWLANFWLSNIGERCTRILVVRSFRWSFFDPERRGKRERAENKALSRWRWLASNRETGRRSFEAFAKLIAGRTAIRYGEGLKALLSNFTPVSCTPG